MRPRVRREASQAVSPRSNTARRSLTALPEGVLGHGVRRRRRGGARARRRARWGPDARLLQVEPRDVVADRPSRPALERRRRATGDHDVVRHGRRGYRDRRAGPTRRGAGARGVERGAHRLGHPAPHAPGRAREGMVGHGGEALLVLPAARAAGALRGRRAEARDRGRARRSSAHGVRPGSRGARPPRPRARCRARRARARGRCDAGARAPRGRAGRRAGPGRSARRPRCAAPSAAPRWHP